jgi:hypothetical protein
MVKTIINLTQKHKSLLAGLLCVVFYLLLYYSHLPFLSADADLSMASGRGAWTDEGNYTCQIRNYINHNRFDVLGYDTFLKTPLFSLFLAAPFGLTGTTLETARTAALSFVLLIIAFFSLRKNYRLAGVVLAATTLMLAPVYLHTHLALAEMCSTALILIAGLLYSLSLEKNRLIFLFCSFISLAGAVLFKIQFFYVLFIPLLGMTIDSLTAKKSIFSRELFFALLCVTAISLLMLALWYLPFRYEWSVIIPQQASIAVGRPFSYLYFKINLANYFLSRHSLPFTLSFLIALGLAVYNIIKNRFPPRTKSIVLFSLAWFIIELHKLFMNYLPIRYTISVYFSMGLLLSIVFAHYLTAKNNKIVKTAAVLCVLAILSGNLLKYADAYRNRSFNIADVNKYLALNTNKDDVVIGAWAPALTWESKNISYPIASDFCFRKNENIMESYKPQIIISEPDEADSGYAYKRRGIDLDALAESSRQFRIALWNIKIYRLKPQ